MNHTLSTIRTKLLNWFDEYCRDLPWRVDRDPYRIWVSEVMLQQTTVAAVIGYYDRFIAAFPTVQSLAAADEQQVLKLWEGLGYYRRARHLHAAAQQLVAHHNALLPDDPEVWTTLPGVGRYILGAVLSQAFDRQLPIVEANSLRVLSRLYGYRGDPRTGEGKAWVWSTAEAMLPRTRVGDFNQSLMELGALVCTPATPECDRCPLAACCVANREGLQEQLPPRKRPKDIVQVHEVGVVLRKRNRILLCKRRSDAARWQNMWEVPHAPREPDEDIAIAAVRIAKERTGITIEPGAKLLTIRHTVTRHAITLDCVEANVRRGAFASEFYAEAKWVPLSELTDYPVSSPQRRLMGELASR